MQRLTDKTSNSKCPTRCPIGIGWVLVCAWLAACSEYKDATDQLEWMCLGAPPEAPPLPGNPGATVLYGLQLVDLATGLPFPDVEVRACPLTETECANPVGPVFAASEQGFVDIPLFENFVGYLEIVSPTAVPYIFHLPDDGLVTDRDFPLAMISKASFSQISDTLDVDIDMTLGGIAVRAFDCNGNPAEGVRLKSNTGGIGWYFDGSLPRTDRSFTDRGGLGGFVNAKPGVTDFEATLATGEQQITSKRILVRAGWMTAGYMRPRVAD